MKPLGILAYGSLRNNPDKEIEAITSEVIEGVRTPFNVEFARTSVKRGNAPTLVPVSEGGSPQAAVIFVVNCDLQTAMDAVWRRERNAVGSGEAYKRPENPTRNSVLVDWTDNFNGIGRVLYTQIEATIPFAERTPQHLARMAVDSVGRVKGGRDGISYLRDAIIRGTSTPLTRAYADAIMLALGVETLEAALDRLGIPYH